MPPALFRNAVDGPSELSPEIVEQYGPTRMVVVRHQGTGQGVQHLGGRASSPAMLQPGQVVGGHPREGGHLVAAQAGNPPVALDPWIEHAS